MEYIITIILILVVIFCVIRIKRLVYLKHLKEETKIIADEEIRIRKETDKKDIEITIK